MKIISFLLSIFRRSAPDKWADGERKEALDILDQHGLRANYYMPAVGIEDQVLANACRRLASAGYIITSADGTITGKVAVARPTKNEQLEYRRASFKLVVNK
jgi:hypothetical protein